MMKNKKIGAALLAGVLSLSILTGLFSQGDGFFHTGRCRTE